MHSITSDGTIVTFLGARVVFRSVTTRGKGTTTLDGSSKGWLEKYRETERVLNMQRIEKAGKFWEKLQSSWMALEAKIKLWTNNNNDVRATRRGCQVKFDVYFNSIVIHNTIVMAKFVINTVANLLKKWQDFSREKCWKFIQEYMIWIYIYTWWIS